MCRVIIETGVIFATIIGLKEGYSLKQWFLMHRNKKQSLVKQYNI